MRIKYFTAPRIENTNCMLLEKLRSALTKQNMATDAARKSFQLSEFQAKLFSMQN